MENRWSELFQRWKQARPVLQALGIRFPLLYQTKIRYKILPDDKFFAIWAFQHQKALREFVRVTGGDEFNDSLIIDTANYLWEKDPCTVERREN